MALGRALLLTLSVSAVGLAGWLGMSSKAQQAAAATPERPCPESGEPCRILPLGDSITWGMGYEGGYRVPLFRDASAAGKHITFVGPLENGPELVAGQAFPRRNEGLSGWTIAQVTTAIPSPALDMKPHVILLHVGTNDIYARSSPTHMASLVEVLLDRLVQAAPHALIVVAQIVPLSDPALRELTVSYNAELARLVGARRARGEHLLLVDQFSGFSPGLLHADGVHPSQAGYEHMARIWYASIAPFLP